MKLGIILGLLLVTVAGWKAALTWNDHQRLARSVRELEARCAGLQHEKDFLQIELENARAQTPMVIETPGARSIVGGPSKPDPRELLTRLAVLKSSVTTGQPHTLRKILGLLEQLAEAGPAALPAINEFLATGEDTALEASRSKGLREIKALTTALVPPTLRFGLLDVVRQIGGADAEKLLTETLSRSGQGMEIAWLTQLLEEMAPGQHRELILGTAHALLAKASGGDRDYLFEVLKRFGDDSYVGTAEAQLVQTDGKVDRSTLRYLQQALGEKSVTLTAQLYQDPRVTEPDSKESLARVALAYVGANEQAATIFHTAVLDNTLKPDQRRELVEDLNQDGLSSKKDLSPTDLQIVTRRYELTQAYLQQDYVRNDKVLSAAFREADKDLANLLQRASAAKGSR